MANLKGSQKAMRVTKRRTIINDKIRKAYRDVKSEINRRLSKNDAEGAKELLPKYQSEIDKAVKKGVLKKNTAARYKSRIVSQIKKQESN